MQDLENLRFVVSAVRSMFLEEVECLATLAACKSLVSKAQTPLMSVAFLPCLAYPVTEYSTVHTSLCNFVKTQTQLNESSLPVICDEDVCCIVGDIVLQSPKLFKCLIPMLGGFHMTKAPLHCIGKFVKINGLFDTLIETGTFGVKTAKAVAGGTHYVRSFLGMFIPSEVLLK